MAIGHTRNGRGERQDLVDHLHAVAALTAEFATALGAGEAGRAIGLWHDVGKFHPAFQRYLERVEADPSLAGTGPDHKAAGAMLARQAGWPLALLIQGHHGGLRSPTQWQAWLDERVASGEPQDALEIARAEMPELAEPPESPLPAHVEQATSPLQTELFLRLLYSALVDADSLDTERHYTPERTARRGEGVPLAELWHRLERSQEALHTSAPDTRLSRARRQVWDACVAAADGPPGIFRLAVPTGGGKTRSAMGFALRHALRNGQRRVVVAVPYLAITEQTADVYRSIFGSSPNDAAPIVLEHHSASRELAVDDRWDPSGVAAKLAAENWDAPIIVTTTVQLFESLFSNARSACRKLHRLAGSVIVLDEAQALPVGLLRPILDGLTDLSSHFGASVVLSTATQPAFEVIPEFRGIAATDIVPESRTLFEGLARVSYEWQVGRPLAWTEVGEALATERQALAIVNTKPDARALLDALGDPDALHLSTALCGGHRRQVLAEVRARLSSDRPCRLVATQVVEAGVDLDFPVVLRALGPLDSIIQAAGRCNREARLHRGRVVVFAPADGGLPGGSYRVATAQTQALLATTGDSLDPDDPAVGATYFRRLYDLLDADAKGIQTLRARLDYPGVAERFHLIEEDTESLLVAWGTPAQQRHADAIVSRLRRDEGARLAWRALQPCLVSVRGRTAHKLAGQGLIEPLLPGLGRWLGAYDRVRGLVEQRAGAEELVV